MFPFCASQDALGNISRTLQIIILRFIWEPSGIVYFSVIYVDFSVRTSVNANDLMQWIPPGALLKLLRCRFTLLFTNFGSCCVALDAVMLHLAELRSDVYMFIYSFRFHSKTTLKMNKPYLIDSQNHVILKLQNFSCHIRAQW